MAQYTWWDIILGGDTDEDELYVAPTLLDGINFDSKIMEDEIFGPVLPIITYDEFDEAVESIRKLPKPLALYLFSEDENATERVLNEISFGGGAINDTMMHSSLN